MLCHNVSFYQFMSLFTCDLVFYTTMLSSCLHLSSLQFLFFFYILILEELCFMPGLKTVLCFWCIYILCATSVDGDAAACKVILFVRLRGRHHQVLRRYCEVEELHDSEQTVSVLILCCIVIIQLFLAQWREG